MKPHGRSVKHKARISAFWAQGGKNEQREVAGIFKFKTIKVYKDDLNKFELLLDIGGKYKEAPRTTRMNNAKAKALALQRCSEFSIHRMLA